LSGEEQCVEETLLVQAEEGGAFCTTNMDVAELFRQLGIDG